MKTQKLFEDDAYNIKFEAKILEVIDGNKLILDKTLFYAKSGGQPGDTGKLYYNNKALPIVDTIKSENDDSIIHILDRPYEYIEPEKQVKGEIDWDKRYSYMKNHTALHILNYFIMKDTGAMVTGGQIGIDKSRMDFNTDSMDKEFMEKIIENCNEIINKGLKINIEKITVEEFKKDPYLVRTLGVEPPANSSMIRIVNIESLDRQACGGTHLKNTNEIKSIKLQKLQNKGKDNKRVYIIVE